MRGRILTTVTLLAVLGGCASAPTDPREGGLFGGISGLQTGAYEERLREREDRLEQLRATQRALDDEREMLDELHGERMRVVAEERSRLRRLETDVAGLDNRVKQLERQHGEDDRRVQGLRERLAGLRRDIGVQQSALDALEGTGLGDTELDLRRRQLEEQRNALRREYDLLLQLSLELAR